jgi:hypothetical protein
MGLGGDVKDPKKPKRNLTRLSGSQYKSKINYSYGINLTTMAFIASSFLTPEVLL